MKTIATLALCLSLSANDPWTPAQKYAEAAYFTLTTADMLQTLEFRRAGGYEKNPLLGREPSQSRVIVGITTAMALHWWITDMLPSRYRKYWQYVWIGIEADAVRHNWRCGYRVRF
jgi:hypothetical protein